MTLFNQHYPAGSLAFNQLVSAQVQTALDEDIGTGDLTAQLIPVTQVAKFHQNNYFQVNLLLKV